MGGTRATMSAAKVSLSGHHALMRPKPDPELAALEETLKGLERQSREATAIADDIEAAAYDLKAVNPNRKSDEDTRTPAELLDFIATKGREADAALARLRELIP